MRKKRVYGSWAGNPKGIPEDSAKCIEEVFDGDYLMRGRQCRRNRKPSTLYCKQHNPVEKKKRGDKKWAKYRAKQRRRDEQYRRKNVLERLAKGIPTKDLKKYKLVREK